MNFRQYAIAAIIVTCATAGAASAQSSAQPAPDSTMTAGAPNSDIAVNNPGTLAESADTTALATSTYHQDGGLFSWFDHGR